VLWGRAGGGGTAGFSAGIPLRYAFVFPTLESGYNISGENIATYSPLVLVSLFFRNKNAFQFKKSV